MTRQEFDQAFRPMCQALGVKVNQAQADYFFHEFGRDDPRDFAHACRELAMGNPGYLPKLDFFRSNVVAAKDMRMERERQERAGRESSFFQWAPNKVVSSGDRGDEQYAPIFAKCCVKLMLSGPEDRAVATQFCEARLHHPGFVAWMQSWETRSGQVALDWLQAQLHKGTRPQQDAIS